MREQGIPLQTYRCASIDWCRSSCACSTDQSGIEKPNSADSSALGTQAKTAMTIDDASMMRGLPSTRDIPTVARLPVLPLSLASCSCIIAVVALPNVDNVFWKTATTSAHLHDDMQYSTSVQMSVETAKRRRRIA